jgi:hypothetical protein
LPFAGDDIVFVGKMKPQLGRERESGVARVVMKHPGNGEHTRDEESNHYYPTSEP